ncbi:MAG: aminopeptidase [Acidobacteriaceae bacterium]|nr:aminopeptidase [Acidobacteriaceae bacterium]
MASLESDSQAGLAENLDRLAEVAVRVGLNLARGQELVMTAPLEALALARRITEQAYKAGASLVTTLFVDDEATLLRFRYASDTMFDRAPEWFYNGLAAAYASGTARLAITGSNPALLANEEPAKVARANVAMSKASRPALELIARHEINWTIVPSATPAWAKLVFPNESEQDAMSHLWDGIFAATRANASDPVAAWKKHTTALERRVDILNGKRYSALHFRGPGTDLRVGLADDHLWLGGATMSRNGIRCIPNMPTEEVFTTPHKDRVDGVVRSTKPLSYQGALIENIEVRFERGSVVEARSTQGEQVLRGMLDTDEGARKLGEVALVPHSSPVAASGILYWNTLFDENAASHIALGQAYSTCMRNSDSLSTEERFARGANESLIHVDWMIGSGEVDVDGINADRSSEPVMRRGEWV